MWHSGHTSHSCSAGPHKGSTTGSGPAASGCWRAAAAASLGVESNVRCATAVAINMCCASRRKLPVRVGDGALCLHVWGPQGGRRSARVRQGTVVGARMIVVQVICRWAAKCGRPPAAGRYRWGAHPRRLTRTHESTHPPTNTHTRAHTQRRQQHAGAAVHGPGRGNCTARACARAAGALWVEERSRCRVPPPPLPPLTPRAEAGDCAHSHRCGNRGGLACLPAAGTHAANAELLSAPAIAGSVRRVWA